MLCKIFCLLITNTEIYIIMLQKYLYTLILSSLLAINTFAQGQYNLTVDLTKTNSDKITVTVMTPPVTEKETFFYLPKVVPGTYSVANYGAYAENLKAYDKAGKALKVEKTDKNSWKITSANKLHKITYEVNDTWDTPEVKEDIFEPAGTNIEEGKLFVINSFGFFGYLKGKEMLPFEVSINKPQGFYGATALIPTSTDAQKDVFKTANYHELADSPMMYSIPDTAFISVGNAKVLVAVYSPNKKVNAQSIAKDISPVLAAQKDYLGGTLPIEKYAFIIYMSDRQDLTRFGALEHSYSSFYFLPEGMAGKELSSTMQHVAAHEFFHIITPLNIHSEEIGFFNYQDPKMSKHLWLYEGLTEYAAHHVLLKAGNISLQEYLRIQTDKINSSRNYFNDALSFTEMSQKVLDTYKDEYGNVYEKGALIGLCLDVKLRQLSGGKYGTQEMMRDLAKTYGKDKSFKDDELFDKITALTFPEIREFFKKHVEGTEPLPLAETFAAIGIEYVTQGNVLKVKTSLTESEKQLREAWMGKNARIEVMKSIVSNATTQALAKAWKINPAEVPQVVAATLERVRKQSPEQAKQLEELENSQKLVTTVVSGSVTSFSLDGTFSLSAPMQGTRSGTWDISEDNKTITRKEANGQETIWSILEVSADKLVISTQDGLKITYIPAQ